jgi:triacylglycerol lipase
MEVLGGLSPQRRGFVLGCGAVGLIAVIAGAVALSREPAQRGPGVPVMLVHGYGGTPASMTTLATALRHEHRRVEAVALPDQGRADIDLEARVLAAAVDRTGAAAVDLVGFSAGSIVVRTYVASDAGETRTRRVVLLGAPNHGADIASLAVSTDPTSCVDACQQLARNSGFLHALNSRPVPPAIPFVSIWTGNDQTVTPPKSAVLPGATNIEVQSVCPRATLEHGDLVTDPVAIGLTIVSLRGQEDLLRGCKQIRAIGGRALSS